MSTVPDPKECCATGCCQSEDLRPMGRDVYLCQEHREGVILAVRGTTDWCWEPGCQNLADENCDFRRLCSRHADEMRIRWALADKRRDAHARDQARERRKAECEALIPATG